MVDFDISYVISYASQTKHHKLVRKLWLADRPEEIMLPLLEIYSHIQIEITEYNYTDTQNARKADLMSFKL